MFEQDDFRRWLDRRRGGHEIGELPDSLRGRCHSCGTDLASVPYTSEGSCGFCLAYEFGYDDHGDRVAAAVTGVAKIAAGDDAEAFRYLYCQLLEDVLGAVKLSHAFGSDG